MIDALMALMAGLNIKILVICNIYIEIIKT